MRIPLTWTAQFVAISTERHSFYWVKLLHGHVWTAGSNIRPLTANFPLEPKSLPVDKKLQPLKPKLSRNALCDATWHRRRLWTCMWLYRRHCDDCRISKTLQCHLLLNNWMPLVFRIEFRLTQTAHQTILANAVQCLIILSLHEIHTSATRSISRIFALFIFESVLVCNLDSELYACRDPSSVRREAIRKCTSRERISSAVCRNE